MRSLLLVLLTVGTTSVSLGQCFEAAAFVDIGEQTRPQDVNGSYSSAVLTGGAYMDCLLAGFRTGLEFRGTSAGGGLDGPTAIGVTGVLVGPRISRRFGHVHSYVAGLFGPNHADQADSILVTLPGQTYPDDNREGITRQVTAGVDIDWRPHWRIRAFEFSQKFFSGLPDSHPLEVTFGLVLHTN